MLVSVSVGQHGVERVGRDGLERGVGRREDGERLRAVQRVDEAACFTAVTSVLTRGLFDAAVATGSSTMPCASPRPSSGPGCTPGRRCHWSSSRLQAQRSAALSSAGAEDCAAAAGGRTSRHAPNATVRAAIAPTRWPVAGPSHCSPPRAGPGRSGPLARERSISRQKRFTTNGHVSVTVSGCRQATVNSVECQPVPRPDRPPPRLGRTTPSRSAARTWTECALTQVEVDLPHPPRIAAHRGPGRPRATGRRPRAPRPGRSPGLRPGDPGDRTRSPARRERLPGSRCRDGS